MSAATITCPHCKRGFELTDAMAAPIEERYRAAFDAKVAATEAEFAARQKALAAQAADLKQQKESLEEQVAARLAGERLKMQQAADAKAREAVGIELKAALEELAEQKRRVEEAGKRELDIRRRERELEEQREGLDRQMETRLEAERVKIAEKIRRETEEKQAGELKSVQEELAAKSDALRKAQEAELTLRKERAKLEEEKESLALEVQRKIDAERDRIRGDALKQADEQHRLSTAEKDQKIAEMLRQIEDLRRKAEQGSQQAQGEVLEVELERLLKDAFPMDLIEPVPKGVHGGDVLQRVRNELGQVCGTILWESKRTKNWSAGWRTKLRDDGRAARADHFALLSTALPDGVSTFQCVDGVWVTSRACLAGVASALRLGIMQVADAKRAMQGQQGKMELVYHYLTGPQFRQRVEAIVESFSTMQDDLAAERRAMEKLWAKREKQLERAALNAVGMHGDLAGIVGKALPEIEGMALPELARLGLDGDEAQ